MAMAVISALVVDNRRLTPAKQALKRATARQVSTLRCEGLALSAAV